MAFFAIPNLLFALFGRFFFLTRELINIDYALLGAIWLWLPSSLRVALFAIVFILDAVTATGSMYNIHPFGGVIALLKAPIGLIVVVLIGLILAGALATSFGWFALRYLRDRRRKYLVFGTLLIIALASVFTGVASSSVRELTYDVFKRDRSARVYIAMKAASDDLRNDADTSENIVLVMMESMGRLKNPKLDSLVFSPFENLGNRYEVRRGDVAFKGGTTSGELRELCGMSGDYITLRPRFVQHCLPRQLKKRGYTTHAVHGFRSSYYNRDRWYPMLFDSVYFQTDLMRARECGTQFRGVCDRDAFEKVKSLTYSRSHAPAFVYWLTMDAHTPVEVSRMQEFEDDWNELDLNELPICEGAPEVCLQALFWRDTNARVAALAADPALPPTRFLIVGDHAPAFVRRKRGEQFVPGRVPYVELISR